jgi:hypothetical protein
VLLKYPTVNQGRRGDRTQKWKLEMGKKEKNKDIRRLGDVRINNALHSAKKNSINSTVQGFLRQFLELIFCHGNKPEGLLPYSQKDHYCKLFQAFTCRKCYILYKSNFLLLFLISKRRRPQKELYALTYGQT